MSKQPTRRRRVTRAARVLVVVAVVLLVALVGAGPALAVVAPADEHVLERQGRVDHQLSAGQADEQGKAKESSQQKATEIPRRYFRPEPPMDTSPRLDIDEPVAPAPAPPAQDSSRIGLAITLAVVALLLAVGGAATWRIRQRRPQRESTQPELTQPDSIA
jgi:uncharacterized protein HemX